MTRVQSEETTIGEETVAADGAVVSPTVDFLALLSLTLVAAATLTVLL
jgi:hypothetical protein